MTQMKERAVALIERIPDDNMFYVLNILENIEEMSSNKSDDKKQAMEALQNILKFSGRLPADFDADKELEEGVDLIISEKAQKWKGLKDTFKF